MQHIVYQVRGSVPAALTAHFPERLAREVTEFAAQYGTPEEIRLRRGRATSVTKDGKNLLFSSILSENEMDRVLLSLCQNSLYAHEETIKKGYIAFPGGVRIGVCGRAALGRGGEIDGVSSVSSLIIRLPAPVPDTGDEIVSLFERGCAGVLLYAPPGVGKTTLLRAVAHKAARTRRVALIDTREELFAGLSSPDLLLDILSGYPRARGIEIAARTLSAELIVCDEIGDGEDARALLEAGDAGVPILATAHAAKLSSLLARPSFRRLHEARLFDVYVGLARKQNAFDFRYDVRSREDADAVLRDL